MLQGLSAAVVYSVGLAILVDTVGMVDIGRNSGYFISSANMGVLISPLIGGFVYSTAGYRAVSIMMVSLVAVDIMLRLVMIEKSAAAFWQTDSDEEANVQRPIFNAQPTYGASDTGLDQPQRKERTTPVFLRLLVTPRALADMYAVLVSYTVLSAFDAGLAVFVKDRFQWSSSAAGATFLLIAIPSLLSPIAGSLSDRFGPKWIAVAGFGVSAAALFGIGSVTKPSSWELAALFGLLFLIGEQ